MKRKPLNFVLQVYTAYFLMFLVMLALLIYAPVWAAVLGGLAVAFFGALWTDRQLKNIITAQNPFLAIKDLGGMLALAFVPPNKILMFPAKKDIAKNSVRIRILKNGGYEEVEQYLTPEQEFQLQGKGEIKKKYHIMELLDDPAVLWELEDPNKQIFRLDPINIETVVFVYPTEVITQEQLKVWNLQKEGDVKLQVPGPDGKPMEKVVPMYSPKPYSISTDNVKQLSAHHRFSQLGTVLEQTRQILMGAERAAAGGFKRFGGILDTLKKNPGIIVVIILLLGGLFFAWMLGQMTHVISAKTATTAIQKAAETGATKFP